VFFSHFRETSTEMPRTTAGFDVPPERATFPLTPPGHVLIEYDAGATSSA
jgi:hypothetical protein